jgi:hypothetical protein
MCSCAQTFQSGHSGIAALGSWQSSALYKEHSSARALAAAVNRSMKNKKRDSLSRKEIHYAPDLFSPSAGENNDDADADEIQLNRDHAEQQQRSLLRQKLVEFRDEVSNKRPHTISRFQVKAHAKVGMFPFSRRKGYQASDIVLSPDRFKVSRTTCHGCAWTRSDRGIGAGCGVVRWAVQLSKEGGFMTFMVGVASAAFKGKDFNGVIYPKHTWFFRNDSMIEDQKPQGDRFDVQPFAAGDVVIVELERVCGVDGKLRVRVAGKTPRELLGLPQKGFLYPIVALSHNLQSCTMVALNTFCCLEL